MRFLGYEGDQEQRRSVRVRPRTEVSGSMSFFGVCADAVALIMDLMSCFSSLPENAPLSSNYTVKSVRMVRYGRTLRAIEELMTKSDRNLDEFTMHPLSTGGAMTMAAGGDISKRATQRKERWKTGVYKASSRKVYRMREGCHVS